MRLLRVKPPIVTTKYTALLYLLVAICNKACVTVVSRVHWWGLMMKSSTVPRFLSFGEIPVAGRDTEIRVHVREAGKKAPLPVLGAVRRELLYS